MAVELFVHRVRRDVRQYLPGEFVDQVVRECGIKWRDRLLTPLVTLRLFLLQVLHGNTAINHLRHLSGLGFSAAAYCEARGRLKVEVIEKLLEGLVSLAKHRVGAGQEDGRRLPCSHVPGRVRGRVLVVDGSSFTTADTPELRKHFGLCPGAGPGVGYPMGKLLGLLDLATGMFVTLLSLPVLVHDMANVVRVHPQLQKGDILLGDRAFCSFEHFALLMRRGVDVCCRLHQKRQGQGATGRRRWTKGRRVPAWMHPGLFGSLPESVEVRLVSYALLRRGYRTTRVTLATTLTDEQAWPDEQLAELYGLRWEIEGCFDHLKTTMKMNVLRCQSVDGVMKELAMYLLAYNLVRLEMLRAGVMQEVDAGRVSFIDALRRLCVQATGLPGVGKLIVNPLRPGRWSPRVIRGRMKAYDLMTRPRHAYQRPGEQANEPVESG